MLRKLIAVGGLLLVGVGIGAGREHLDSKYGRGASAELVDVGVGQAKQSLYEAGQVPGIAIEALRPGAQRVGQSAQGLIGGLSSTTPSTAAPQWDNRVSPSQQAAPGE